MLFLIFKFSFNIFLSNTVLLFIGGSGILFIYEAANFIWIKDYSDVFSSNFDIFYVVLISNNYNLTEIFLPFMYQSKEWETLSMEEQLKFYKAFLLKPDKRRGKVEYKDIQTTVN